MAIFIAVDAVLVVAFVIVLAVVLGGGTGTPGVSAAPDAGVGTSQGTTPSSGASAPAGTPAALESFALPSGNIACTMSADGVTCTIASATFAAPTSDAACDGSTGHVFTVDADGAHVPCTTGDAPGVAPSSTPVLEYGHVSEVGDYRCTSATDGVTCVRAATGVGFRLARAHYTALP